MATVDGRVARLRGPWPNSDRSIKTVTMIIEAWQRDKKRKRMRIMRPAESAKRFAKHTITMTLVVVSCLLGLVGEAVSPAQSQILAGASESQPAFPFVFEHDLRVLPTIKPWEPGDRVVEIPQQATIDPSVSQRQRTVLPQKDPRPELQESYQHGVMDADFSSPDLNFEGIGFSPVSAPPDPVGDVGPSHYIQMVNAEVDTVTGSRFAIYDKKGNKLGGPWSLSSLWTGTGAGCEQIRVDDPLIQIHAIDPIVLYDRLADRWLLSQFIYFPAIDYGFCIAISRGPNPLTDGWFLYEFKRFPWKPDYPKYGVWPDAANPSLLGGYFVSTNDTRGFETIPAAYVMDRGQMLRGLSVRQQRLTLPPLEGFSGRHALIPSDLDGPIPPPAGSPNFYIRHRDDEVHNPGSNDASRDFMEIYELHPNFDDPNQTRFVGPTMIPIREFEQDECKEIYSVQCIPQPNTTLKLDSINPVVMWRLQYRNFGSSGGTVWNGCGWNEPCGDTLV